MAQYQPFVLQVQRPGQNFSTGNNNNYKNNEVDTRPLLEDGKEYTPESNKSHTSSWSQRARMVVVGCLCVTALALFFTLFAVPLGRIDKMTNTKSMHFTRNKNAYTWMALFPSQAYMEKESIVTYRTVDGVLDKKDVDSSENHGFQIAGGFGILTNISTNVYVSALLVIYVLSLLDAAVFDGDPSKSDSKERKTYFTWAIVFIGILFVLMHLSVHFSTWHDLEWGKSNIKATYMWESGASLLYASLVVGLFIVHLNVKHHTWQSIIPGVSERQHGDRAHGTPDTGPYSNEANTMFAISFFLLVMGLLGDTRQTVLETEAQLLVLTAIGLAVITVLSTRVRAYFHYIEHKYLQDHNHEAHKHMVLHALALVDVITLAVSFAFFGIVFNVLATMYDSSEWGLFFYTVIVVTAFYMLMKFVQLIFELGFSYGYNAEQKTKDMWSSASNTYYFFSVIVTLAVVIVLLVWNDDRLDILRALESAQHVTMDKALLKSNSQCLTTGMQSNGLVYSELELKSDSKLMDTNKVDNPIVFKVNAWTNWWSLKTESTSLGADLYLCSTGLEQEFGSCRAQYRAKNGKVYGSALQTSIDAAAADFATSPPA
jgi:hypothetical protein